MTFGPGDDAEFQLNRSGVNPWADDFPAEGDPDVYSDLDADSGLDLDPDVDPDAAPEPEPEYHTALPPRIESWRKRSAAGAILTGFALGLQEALETKRQDPAIVVQTSGDPPRDLPVEADFEYGRPRQSVVSIRPWLLEGTGGERDSTDAGPDPGESEAGSGPR